MRSVARNVILSGSTPAVVGAAQISVARAQWVRRLGPDLANQVGGGAENPAGTTQVGLQPREPGFRPPSLAVAGGELPGGCLARIEDGGDEPDVLTPCGRAPCSQPPVRSPLCPDPVHGHGRRHLTIGPSAINRHRPGHALAVVPVADRTGDPLEHLPDDLSPQSSPGLSHRAARRRLPARAGYRHRQAGASLRPPRSRRQRTSTMPSAGRPSHAPGVSGPASHRIHAGRFPRPRPAGAPATSTPQTYQIRQPTRLTKLDPLHRPADATPVQILV